MNTASHRQLVTAPGIDQLDDLFVNERRAYLAPSCKQVIVMDITTVEKLKYCVLELSINRLQQQFIKARLHYAQD
ncbi:unnamed protein product [Arctia plantaginis]|uniref:Uncharacterized protein n=1 Tax=Arctia plantaginis TaxID=874455 RepID=A0A8S0Z578_ARCPL|nr:unnamed protein product [Arctia plantaginis]